MRLVSYRFFAGPNRHTLNSAAEAVVDLGPFAERETTHQPHFIPRLLQIFPGLEQHHCGLGYPGGFLERLWDGTFLGHVGEHVALELVHLAGEEGTYGKTRRVADGDGRFLVVFETESHGGGHCAISTALTLVEKIWEQAPDNLKAIVQTACEAINRHRLGPSTRSIVQAARRRQIPVARLDDSSFIRLGQGCRQRRLNATLSDLTSVVGVELAQEKAEAKSLLESAGIPVPSGTVVHTIEEARQAARNIGFPVVLKPLDGHHGIGVSMGLDTPESIERAFLHATLWKEGPVLVEREIAGTAYRLLVVGDEMVAATERIPPAVIGDGRHTLAELVEALNADPRRGPGHGYAMSRVELDGPALLCLAQQDVYPQTVLEPGRRAEIRRTANMSTGAHAKDVTDLVHADLAKDAVRATKMLGLDIAGVDVVTPDLGQGLIEAGGAVVEVNAAPGLRMHLFPEIGSPRRVDEKILDHLFGDRPARIPVAAVTGTNGKTTVTRMLGHIWETCDSVVGMATTDGISIGGRVIQRGDLTGPWSARLILNDPTVEVAVLETARGGMVRGGLGFDDLDVAVVTNIDRDHLGQDGIETLEDLCHLKALLVDVVRPEGTAVLNADDPLVLKMAERCRGRVMLFSAKEDNLVVKHHLDKGEAAVFVKRGNLVFGQGNKTFRLVGTRVLPASMGGIATVNVSNAAAAAAAALAMGAGVRQVAGALATFPLGDGLNRGRLEMLSGSDLRILIDYGHNSPAVMVAGEICRRLRPKEVVTVLGLPGDRRDQDLRETARAAAQFSHRIVVREDADRRGRAVGELADLICQTLKDEGVEASNIIVELDEAEATRTAILSAERGALVLVLFERYGVVQNAVASALAEREKREESESHALPEAQ